MLRVILLLALSIFSTQAWSYVTSPIHHYDVNECYYIDQNIQSECQNHQYDGKQTSFKTVACLQADSIGKRTLNGTFFVFLDGFVAAKSIGEISKSQLKGIQSLEKQIQKHQQKLDNFKANPTVRPGMENLPIGVIKRQQGARIKHLETEINTFKNNIAKIKSGEL